MSNAEWWIGLLRYVPTQPPNMPHGGVAARRPPAHLARHSRARGKLVFPEGRLPNKIYYVTCPNASTSKVTMVGSSRSKSRRLHLRMICKP